MSFLITSQNNSVGKRPAISITYSRPADWPVIVDDANKLQMLVCDVGTASFKINTVFSGSGTCSIDWGDGTISTGTTASSTTTQHTYTPGTGATCSRGYWTYVITVSTTSGATLSTCKPVVPTADPYRDYGVLEVIWGDNICTAMSFNAMFGSEGSPNASTCYNLLEYIKLPSIYTGSDLQYLCGPLSNLQKAVMPTVANSITTGPMFQNCISLVSCTLPQMNSATSFQQAFTGCTSLTDITFNTTSYPAITSCSSLFATCANLGSITLPSMPLCTDYTSIFDGCYNLASVDMRNALNLSVSKTYTFTTAFRNCYSLTRCIFPTTVPSGTLAGFNTAFQICSQLQKLAFPENMNITDLGVCFSGCSSLNNVIFPTSCNNLTTCGQAFLNCYNLESVNLPTSTSGAINVANMFQNCSALASLTFPSSWNLTAINLCFSQCYSIKTINLPNNTQNGITSMSSTFASCYSLESITLPTSMTGASNCNSVFGSCYRIKSIVFPATMSSVTTFASAFTNCRELRSITMPTSAPLVTTYASAFSGCRSLITVTLPSSVNVCTTFASTFQFCANLTTVTLPPSATFSTTINSMFNQDVNLVNVYGLTGIGNPSTSGALVDGTSFGRLNTPTLDFNCKFSKLSLAAVSSYGNINVTSLRLRNTGGSQWTGSSPQIEIAYTNITYANLVTLFNDIAAQGAVSSKTINITGCTGAASLTAGDRLILTSLGWTITG